jgi:hypothetical protein
MRGKKASPRIMDTFYELSTQDVAIRTCALEVLQSINADKLPNPELRKVRVPRYSVSSGWAQHKS